VLPILPEQEEEEEEARPNNFSDEVLPSDSFLYEKIGLIRLFQITLPVMQFAKKNRRNLTEA
jgi:hypothetical protein